MIFFVTILEKENKNQIIAIKNGETNKINGQVLVIIS